MSKRNACMKNKTHNSDTKGNDDDACSVNILGTKILGTKIYTDTYIYLYIHTIKKKPTILNPRAMMIHAMYTFLALLAMHGSWRSINVTFFAKFHRVCMVAPTSLLVVHSSL